MLPPSKAEVHQALYGEGLQDTLRGIVTFVRPKQRHRGRLGIKTGFGINKTGPT